MKKLFFTIISLLGAATLFAQAPGSSCHTAIRVDSTYSAVISTPGTYWYTAWTYDLPLRVVFTPNNPNTNLSMRAEIDFTCTPGVYDNPVLEELFTDLGGARVEMPAKIDFKRVIINNAYVYMLDVSENYREMMTKVGLTEEVQAYVKVVFTETGTVALTPDLSFRDCIEAGQFAHIGTTLPVLPNDKNSVFILPFSEWKNDSVRFLWEGSGNKDLQVYLSRSSCVFDPDDLQDPAIWHRYTISSNGYYDYSAEQIDHYLNFVTNDDTTGMDGLYYAKLVSEGAGRFSVIQKPERTPDLDAKLLHYDQQEYVERDVNALFALRVSEWTQPTQWTAQASGGITMEVATDAAFTHVIGTYPLAREENGDKKAYWSQNDVNMLTSAATDIFLYVRFTTTSALVFTPSLWDASDCAAISKAIELDQPIAVAAKAKDVIYRLRYADIAGGKLTLTWNGRVACPTYIADTCIYTLSGTNSHLVQNGYMNVQANNSMSRDSLVVAQWASRVDADGFLFVRFNPNAAATMTFSVDRRQPQVTPEDPEPERPTKPTGPTVDPITPEGNTVVLDCATDNKIRITVTEEQTVVIYDSYGQIVRQQHMTTADVLELAPVCGVEYVVKGKENTIRFIR